MTVGSPLAAHEKVTLGRQIPNGYTYSAGRSDDGNSISSDTQRNVMLNLRKNC